MPRQIAVYMKRRLVVRKPFPCQVNDMIGFLEIIEIIGGSIIICEIERNKLDLLVPAFAACFAFMRACCDHLVLSSQLRYHIIADETGCAGDQNFFHALRSVVIRESE